MPKTTLHAANVAAANRQGNVGTMAIQAVPNGISQVLAAMASHLHYFIDHRNTQSVTAFGYRASTGRLYVARNGQLTASGLEARVMQAARHVQVDFADMLDWGMPQDVLFEPTLVNVNAGFGETDVWHAEMMIMHHLIGEGVPKAQLQWVAIGASTQCCVNCAGWMSKYAVHHAPAGTPGGAPTSTWKHPTSLANTAYGPGGVTYYKHPGRNESLS